MKAVQRPEGCENSRAHVTEVLEWELKKKQHTHKQTKKKTGVEKNIEYFLELKKIQVKLEKPISSRKMKTNPY